MSIKQPSVSAAFGLDAEDPSHGSSPVGLRLERPTDPRGADLEPVIICSKNHRGIQEIHDSPGDAGALVHRHPTFTVYEKPHHHPLPCLADREVDRDQTGFRNKSFQLLPEFRLVHPPPLKKKAGKDPPPESPDSKAGNLTSNLSSEASCGKCAGPVNNQRRAPVYISGSSPPTMSVRRVSISW